MIRPLILLTLCCVGAAASEVPLPALENHNGHVQLLVDSKPFLILGGQVNNSTPSDDAQLERELAALETIQANTAFVPVYWELLEPCEGTFDFALVDRAIAKAREHHLRLVLLWLGAWKNGAMHCAPEWVKRDKTRFSRVLGARGEEMAILSPLADTTRQADAIAFAAMMKHVRQLDEKKRTVILVQVENEAGLLGADRDYSAKATDYFEGPVPPELMACISTQGGDATAGTWPSVFGDKAAETCTAWSVARYVDAVAAAGCAEYPLPLYANAWLARSGERAGAWPSGGPNEHMLAVWKCAAPHLDFLAPDIYCPDFEAIAAAYSREDNPLFIPEVNFEPYYAAFAFAAFAGHDALCYSAFGMGELCNGGAQDAPPPLVRVYGVVHPLLPLLAERRYTGTLFPLLQEAGENLDTTETVQLGDALAANVTYTMPFDMENGRGAGMIVKLSRDEYIVAGMGFDIAFRELEGPPRDAEFLSLEEGTFLDGQWTPQRRLNGDELQVSLPDTGRILRVRLLR